MLSLTASDFASTGTIVDVATKGGKGIKISHTLVGEEITQEICLLLYFMA